MYALLCICVDVGLSKENHDSYISMNRLADNSTENDKNNDINDINRNNKNNKNG